MTTLNSYATLAEFKSWKEITGTDATRDADLEIILENASRHLDDLTGREFYPRIETRYFSVPESRELRLDADLLEVITLTNGDGTAISSTQYYTLPRNRAPYYALVLKIGSTEAWDINATDDDEYTIGINGVWAYHNTYSLAWKSVGTLGADIASTTTTTATMTGGHSVLTSKIYRVDNEIFIPSVVSTNTLTLYGRGMNGSTAATHTSGTTVYEWQPMTEVKKYCLEKGRYDYSRRFGESPAFGATVTGAGVVLSPRDIGKAEEDLVKHLRRKL